MAAPLAEILESSSEIQCRTPGLPQTCSDLSLRRSTTAHSRHLSSRVPRTMCVEGWRPGCSPKCLDCTPPNLQHISCELFRPHARYRVLFPCLLLMKSRLGRERAAHWSSQRVLQLPSASPHPQLLHTAPSATNNYLTLSVSF
jgi:hypothetical protein